MFFHFQRLGILYITLGEAVIASSDRGQELTTTGPSTSMASVSHSTTPRPDVNGGGGFRLYNSRSTDSYMHMLINSYYGTMERGAYGPHGEEEMDLEETYEMLTCFYSDRIADALRWVGNLDNVNKIGPMGATALSCAVSNAYYDVVALLIEKGANVNLCNFGGESPLMRSMSQRPTRQPETEVYMRESYRIANLLIRSGADVNHSANSGRTALLDAVTRGRKDIVELLIRNGADVNKAGSRGRTALMHAAATRQIDIVQLLIDNGANVEAIDSDWPYGRTAFDIARQHLDFVIMQPSHFDKPEVLEQQYVQVVELVEAKGPVLK